MAWQTGGGNIPADLTDTGGRGLATAESLRQSEAESLTATLLLKQEKDENPKAKADAHSAENLRVAVNTILSDAEAEREATDEKCAAIKRASQSASAKAATMRLREVMKQVDAEETPLNHVTRVHRGAAAAAEADEGESAS